MLGVRNPARACQARWLAPLTALEAAGTLIGQTLASGCTPAVATTLLRCAVAGRVNPVEGPSGSGRGGAYLPSEAVICDAGALRVAASAGSGGPPRPIPIRPLARRTCVARCSCRWRRRVPRPPWRITDALARSAFSALVKSRRVCGNQDAAGPSDAAEHADAERGDCGSSIERLRR